MWIGSTNSYSCPACHGTTLSSALGSFSDLRTKTIVSYDKYGKLVVDNRKDFPNKMNWEDLSNGNS